MKILTNNVFKWLLVLIGTIVWSLTMVKSGWIYSYGIGFWGANGHDGVWHVALAESLSRGSFQLPTFASLPIQNYHIGFDLILAILHKITFIPVVNLYFQITPPILALAIGLLSYAFVYIWRKSKIESLIAVFFVYFGGSFGWLVSLFRGQGWGGESMYWSQQSISTLINPPFALSLITILLGLIYLKKYLEKKTLFNFCLTALFLGVSIFIKVYAGLLVLTSILIVAIWQIIRKKDYFLLWIFLVTAVISMFLFIPFNKSSVNLIVFTPFWFLESMMAYPDRFNWYKLYSAMTTYRMGRIWGKAILAYGLAFVIFIVGNFSTRLVALKPLLQKPKKLLTAGPIEIFLFALILAGIVVPMFFTQKGTPWNTIQFFYYSLIFGGIAAGVVIGNFIESKSSSFTKGLIITIFVLLTIPTTIASMGYYLPEKPPSVIPTNELEALKFLSQQPDGIVLTYPYNSTKILGGHSLTPLYMYDTTAYVSAFSDKDTFLEDQTNLDNLQYPWQGRRNSVESFLTTLNISSARSFLEKNNISYIYWLTDQHAKLGAKQLGLTQIFQNNNVTIFKVN